MKNYEEMDEVELWGELANATPGSDEARAIDRALRKFGDGLSFFDRHPFFIYGVGYVLVGATLIWAIIVTILRCKHYM